MSSSLVFWDFRGGGGGGARGGVVLRVGAGSLLVSAAVGAGAGFRL